MWIDKEVRNSFTNPPCYFCKVSDNYWVSLDITFSSLTSIFLVANEISSWVTGSISETFIWYVRHIHISYLFSVYLPHLWIDWGHKEQVLLVLIEKLSFRHERWALTYCCLITLCILDLSLDRGMLNLFNWFNFQ